MTINIDLTPDKDGYSPQEYRAFLVKEIAPYVDQFLTFENFVLLYSGPSERIWKGRRIKDIKSNNALSASVVEDFKNAEKIIASRINDTQAAKSLAKHNLDAYFYDYYVGLDPKLASVRNKKKLQKLLNEAYAIVWGGISEEFVKRDFHHAATAVCGADHTRVFVKDELPTLVREGHLETINGIPFEAVKKVYEEVSPDEAFKLVCLSEINFVYSRQHISKFGEAAVIADAKKRIEYYQSERRYTKRKVSKLSDDQKKNLKTIVDGFKLNALYKRAPQNWRDCILPTPALSTLAA